ncbi:MAG: HU family DNA-binding protein [Candidatus Obscuribacterales bacterium]|jgi:DNA-binding protein HU-beta|nr:HU family DNA-binding protein [Candidatus Obscuribacterales bacterium]
MNRAELINAVAEITGQTKQQTGNAVNAILHTITGALSKGERVMLVGFGTFERRNRKARSGVNPQNPRQKLTIAAAKVPAFRAGQELKDIVDGRAKLPAPPKSESSSKPAKKAAAKPAKKAAKPAKKPAKKAAKKRR